MNTDYDQVPKSVETSHEGKVTYVYYGTNKCQPTELFLTINRTVIIKRELA